MIILTVQRFFFPGGNPPLVHHQFHQLHTSFLENCAVVFTHCTLLRLLSHHLCESPLGDTGLFQVSASAARCLPPGCNLCIRCNDGSFPLCMNMATAAAATPHTLIIPPLRSLRPVGFFCPFLAGKCLHAELCQNQDQKKS